MTTETIVEGEARELPEEEAVPERALTVTAPAVQSSVIVGGIAALARMSDETFDENLAALAKVRERVDKVKLALMVDGVDYGPPFAGSKKDVLLKPGTETLLRAFGLADSYVIEETRGNGETEPDLSVLAHARIHISDTSGPVIAEGIGAANTWETKHRYRGGELRVCPDCGKANIMHSRPPRTGWWCGTRDGGCGHSFPEDNKAITDQQVGKAENPDPWDLANTVIKMAKKRALVDGVLTATGTSGLFSQDEDAPGAPKQPTQPAGGAPQGAAPATGQPRQSGPSAAPGPSEAGTGGEDVLPAGVIQAVVSEKPDPNVRIVQDGHTEKRWTGPRPKLELITKVGNRKHTGIILGPLAEAAAVAAIQVGEVVRFIGCVVEEIEWQEGKPKKKEVWGPPPTYLMSDLQVMRDGVWWSVNSAMPTLLPSADVAAGSASEANAEPAAAPSTSSSTTAPDAAKPERMHGVAGEYAAFSGKLLDPIVFTERGDTPIAVLRVVDEATGQLIMAALGEDIEGMVGTKEAPFVGVGDRVGLYGEWKGDWLIVQTVGRKAAS